MTNSVGPYADDVYITKYSSSGGYLWSKIAGVFNNDQAWGVCCDSANNIYVTGFYTVMQETNVINFGCGDMQGTYPWYNADPFVAKYDSSGTCLWATNFGGPASDQGQAIGITTNDNIVAAGAFAGASISICGSNLSATTIPGMYLSMINSNAGCIWARSFGARGVSRVCDLIVDRQNNILIAGYFTGNADFGDGTVSANGSFYAGFLVKYKGTDGSLIWKKIYNQTFAASYGVAIDPTNGVLVSGMAQNGTDFGGGAIVTDGGYAIFLAKYDSAGTYLWHKKWGGMPGSYSYGTSIASDSEGLITLGGYFQGDVAFDGTNIVSATEQKNPFVMGLSTTGSYRWLDTVTTIGEVKSMTLDGENNPIACGWIQQSGVIAGISITNNGAPELSFAARYRHR